MNVGPARQDGRIDLDDRADEDDLPIGRTWAGASIRSMSMRSSMTPQ